MVGKQVFVLRYQTLTSTTSLLSLICFISSNMNTKFESVYLQSLEHPSKSTTFQVKYCPIREEKSIIKKQTLHFTSKMRDYDDLDPSSCNIAVFKPRFFKEVI